jgi:peptidoglycan-associated lipoprotein
MALTKKGTGFELANTPLVSDSVSCQFVSCPFFPFFLFFRWGCVLAIALLLEACGLSGGGRREGLKPVTPPGTGPGGEPSGVQSIPLPTPVTIAPTPRSGDVATSSGGEMRPGNPMQWGEAASLAVGRTFDPIYFDFDSDELSPNARGRLNDYAQWLRQNPRVWVCLPGHCDRHGSAEYNYNLGMARSLAAINYLVGQGVETRRLFPISYGEDRPAVEGDTPEADALNRRVEFLAFMAPEGEAVPKPVQAVPGGAPVARPPEPARPATDIFRETR